VIDEIPNDSGAAIILLEHRWAIPLRDAVARANGMPIADTFIHPLDLVASRPDRCGRGGGTHALRVVNEEESAQTRKEGTDVRTKPQSCTPHSRRTSRRVSRRQNAMYDDQGYDDAPKRLRRPRPHRRSPT
jgi:hypothetical protein